MSSNCIVIKVIMLLIEKYAELIMNYSLKGWKKMFQLYAVLNLPLITARSPCEHTTENKSRQFKSFYHLL